MVFWNVLPPDLSSCSYGVEGHGSLSLGFELLLNPDHVPWTSAPHHLPLPLVSGSSALTVQPETLAPGVLMPHTRIGLLFAIFLSAGWQFPQLSLAWGRPSRSHAWLNRCAPETTESGIQHPPSPAPHMGHVAPMSRAAAESRPFLHTQLPGSPPRGPPAP